MQHSFLIKGNGVHSLQNDIITKNLNKFIQQFEVQNSDLWLDGFVKTKLSIGWFMNSVRTLDDNIVITCASTNNDGILLDFAKNLCQKYTVDLIYTFFCQRKSICGRIQISADDFSSEVFNSYEEIANSINDSILTKRCIDKLTDKKYLGDGFTIDLMSKKNGSSLGMVYKELLFSLSSKNETIYFLVSLDRIHDPEEYESYQVIEMDGFYYFISNISWNENKEFKIDKTLGEIESKLITSNAFGLINLSS